MHRHYHAIVSIDHREAKVFEVSVTDVKRIVVQSHLSGRHLHHNANTTGGGHRGVEADFFRRVIESLDEVGALPILGPSTPNLELKNYVVDFSPGLAQRISGVETLDRLSDAALPALARKLFKVDDRMHAQV